jgi:DNA-binding NarL/FixJ family response regulator
VIRVLIADDQTLVRDGFRMILDAQEDFEVVGEAADGAEAVAKARELRPDIVLMDVRMPGRDGLDATREIVNSLTDVHVVILTTFDLNEYVYEAMRAGASGFLLKDVPRAQLIAGVRTVAAGDALLAPAITRRLIEQFVKRPPASIRPLPPQVDELTARELEVLRLICDGMSNREIAVTLNLSVNTVSVHRTNIMNALGVHKAAELVVYALQHGLVNLP